MLEKLLALIERGVIALEVIAENKPVAGTAADAVKAEAAAVAEEVKPASTTGRRTRGGAANAAAGAGATSKAGSTGGRSRASTKTVEETAEQKALREQIVTLGVDFAQYPDLVEWVNEYLQRLGCENVTQLPADKLEEVAADWQEKADAEFK